ncbi:MAG: hypothetical protein OHK0046_20100 [Anaerolineae bacterium]
MVFGLEVALPPQSTQIKVGLYPVFNILTSMAMMVSLEPGLESWLVRTGQTLPVELIEPHQIVFFGIGVEALANAVYHTDELPTFSRYLNALEALEPETLRDTLLHWMIHSSHNRIDLDQPKVEPPEIEVLLADQGVFFDYVLAVGYKADLLPMALYGEVHRLLNDPPQLQKRLVMHLRTLWERFVLVEWEKQRPMLEESVRSLQQIDIQPLPPIEAIQVITGRNLHSLFDLDMLSSFKHIRLIPSRHTAPYISWFGTAEAINIIFGARRVISANTLDTPELLNRLQALGDETRLQILLAIKRHEELSTQQIMEIFDLNKSAASRHLKLLRANELIHERRDSDNKTKFYSLKPETLSIISRTLENLF